MPTGPALANWPPILPMLHPQETIYSWCAAVHLRGVSGSATETSRRLFGSSTAALLHDFPSHLRALEARTQGQIGSPFELAMRHSLLGYFLPFIEDQVAERILERVTVGSIPDLKMKLGIPASGLGGYHPLRCCKDCIAQDVQSIGRAIWRVYQQAPTAIVCAEHQRPLVQSWSPSSPVHRREWLAPDARLSEGRHQTTAASGECMETLVRLARATKAIFELAPGALAPKSIGGVYRRWAWQHGALTAAGSIRHRVMLDQIEPQFRHIARAFLALGPVGCELDVAAIIGSIARESPKPAHPAKHLSVLAAMFRNLEELVAEIYLARTTSGEAISASGPAVALSGRADSKDLLLQDFVAAINAGASVRTAARSVGVSVTTGVRWAHQCGAEFTARPKVIDAEMLTKLRADLAQGDDRSAVARRHGISLTSVNRLLSTEHDLLDQWTSARHEAARARHRKIIEAIVAANPSQRGKQIRGAAPASWMWLYRHDQRWLADALPALWSGKKATS